jgi:carbon storage regulator CsrA
MPARRCAIAEKTLLADRVHVPPRRTAFSSSSPVERPGMIFVRTGDSLKLGDPTMLVLSRKEFEKLVFPTVGITVEVLRVRGRTVRLGIDAPRQIPVVRHEIADLKSVDFASDADPKRLLGQMIQATRERLDAAAAILNRLHQHCEESGDATAQELALAAFRELKSLEGEAEAALDGEEPCVARALLVESDTNARTLLAGYLRLRGIETTTADDGRDAVDFLSLHALPDVVLFDMQLPRCDGRCLVNAIRSDASLSSLKLYAVSSVDPGSQGVTIGPGGIDRWFHKPLDPEDLVARIADDFSVAAAI